MKRALPVAVVLVALVALWLLTRGDAPERTPAGRTV